MVMTRVDFRAESRESINNIIYAHSVGGSLPNVRREESFSFGTIFLEYIEIHPFLIDIVG